MATNIVDLNSFRHAAASVLPTVNQGAAICARQKGGVRRQKRNAEAADVVQIPTMANEKQRCEAAVARYKGVCEEAALGCVARTVNGPVTGVIVVTTTGIDGDNFSSQAGGLYWVDPDAALRTLRQMVAFFEREAQDIRNAQAMAAAHPVKRPVFEVAL